MRIVVSGSRDYPNKEQVLDWLERNVSPFTNDTVVVGGARGVDRWAQTWAEDSGIPVDVYPAEWDRLGKVAGYVRNVEMIDGAQRVVCFWDGESPGTKHAIDIALAKRKPLEVVFPNG